LVSQTKILLIMKKRQNLILIGAVAVFSLFSVALTAQCSTFDESPKGEDGLIAHQLYRDAVKAEDLAGAYANWEKAYTIAPAANGKNYLHYADGRKILKIKFDAATDEAEKQKLVDRILKLYDEQVICYGENGQEAYLMGRKAYNVFYYYSKYVPNSDDMLQKTLAKTVELAGNDIEDIILVPYASVVVNKFAAEKMDKAEGRAIYDQLNAIADYNIANNAAVAGRFKQAKEAMNGVFARIERHIFDCDYFVNKLEPAYRQDADNIEVIENTIRELKRQGCEDTVPLLKELEGKYAVWAQKENASRVAEFEANNPASIAKKLYDQGDNAGAIAKYQEAADAETDLEKKAGYMFSIASIQGRKMKQYSTARATALDAAKMRPNWGRPYMLIGDLYASSARNCGSDWNQRMAVLAAIDKYAYGRSVDSSVADEARDKIGKYSASKPEKKDGFMQGIKEGDTARVGCWIGETVRVSFK